MAGRKPLEKRTGGLVLSLHFAFTYACYVDAVSYHAIIPSKLYKQIAFRREYLVVGHDTIVVTGFEPSSTDS